MVPLPTPRDSRRVARGFAAAAALAVLVLSLLAGLAPPASAHGHHDGSPPPPSTPYGTSPLRIAGTLGARSLASPSRIYIANDDHTDYMWSGDEADYRAAFTSMLDYYMTQAETTAWRPSDFRGRFNTDGTLWVREYERTHSYAANQRLWGHIRDGSITVPMNTAVQLYGAMPAEAVIRSFLYAGRLERRENVRFPLVVPMENQTLPGGVASLWAGCGARYCWKGICDCSTQIGAWDRPREVYHFTGPDGQSLLMKWNRQDFGNMSLGGYAEARYPGTIAQYLAEDPEFASRWPYPVAGAFGYGWDDLQTTTHSFIDAAVEGSDPSRRVIVSNEVDFFQDLESSSGGQIENYGACFGNEWDLYTASLGEVTARMKRSVEGLRTAEALASLATHFDPVVWSSLATARDSANLACGLYYEHCFGPGPAITEAVRNQWQRRMEAALTSYVSALRNTAGAFVAARVAQPPGVERHLVFNSLSWTRDDVADLASSISEPRHVVDVTTGAQLPSQTVTVDGVSRLRVKVSGVPSVGYRVLEVRGGIGQVFPPAANLILPSVENGLVRVSLGTRGQITNLVDLAGGGVEMVGTGAALNDIGGSAGTGIVTLESLGPVSVTLRVNAAAPLARDTRVTLYAGSSRVDVKNEIHENFSDAVGYDSRFDLDGMVMRHEEVGMIARVGRLNEGGDYANENTRTDGLSLGHFVDLSRDGRGVTVSAWDSPFFAPGASSVDYLDSTTPSINAVVGNQVDGQGAGIQDQGGDSYFLDRFAFGIHGAWDPAAAMRFSLEHQNPLLGIRVTGDAHSPLPETNFSLLTINSPDVLLWALKPAEEGVSHGLIARVWNLADNGRSATLAIPPFGIVDAWNVTHIETDLGTAALADSTLTVSLARQQIRSYRLIPSGTASVEPNPAGGAALAIWPNPIGTAREGVSIAFTQSRSGTARLTIVDITGSRVATLLQGASDPGRHEVRWIPQSGDRQVKPGIYFARLQTPDGEFSGRIVLLD